MESKLRKLVDEALKGYTQKSGSKMPTDFFYDLQISRDPSHGDYATNVAFKLAKTIHADPLLVANELKEALVKTENDVKGEIIERIEVAGPGFLNTFLKKSCLAEVLLA